MANNINKPTANSPRYNIEKGVPMVSRNNMLTRYPFDGMEVNDSFLIPIQELKTSTYQSVYQSLKLYNTTYKKNIKISARKNPEGMRVWRIK